MNLTNTIAPLAGAALGATLVLGSSLAVRAQVAAAEESLRSPDIARAKEKVAVADHAEEPYCTPPFKEVLQRVLNACGLVGPEARRGCQPADVKTFASISDDDFVALFTPLKERGAVIMFDDGADKLDEGAIQLIEDKWQDRRGARYFFIVARASKTGGADFNRALSHRRANSVMFHVRDKYQDPEIDRKVGMLWLGSEFAQLKQDYCSWNVSRAGRPCNTEAINRSAFISWVDCRL